MQKKFIYFQLFLLLFFNFLQSAPLGDTKKSVRGANPWGFWAEVLWTFNHLEYCLANAFTPVIYWDNEFAYFSPSGFNGSKNAWEYYFEPVSHLQFDPEDVLRREHWYQRDNNFSALWMYNQYISNMHLLSEEERGSFKVFANHKELYERYREHYSSHEIYPIGQYHLYSKAFRRKVYEEIIQKFIKLKPHIRKKINSFYDAQMNGKKTIGIHLRGNHLCNEVFSIPLSFIFQEARNLESSLKKLPNNINDYQFFIATDQQPLLDRAGKELNGNIIYYECQRFEQTTSPFPGKKLNPQLGEDLLIETILLSKCDYLIHTISNVSTAALYFNPELNHCVIY